MIGVKNNEYFNSFIGQKRVLDKLSFYIQAHQKTGFFPTLGVFSPRGFGKTKVCRLIGSYLVNPNTNTPKDFFEINGSAIRGLNSFVDDVVNQYMVNDRQCVILIDESHAMDKTVEQWLLSVINPTIDNKTTAYYRGQQFDFNFHALSLLFATTNPEKHSKPFLSRLKRIEFKHYSNDDLIKILRLNTKHIDYPDGAEDLIVSISRQNPRLITEIGKDIDGFCKVNGQSYFSIHDWASFSKTLNIYPLGLMETEIEYLKFLDQRGSQTLTAISAYLGLDSTTVRRETENFLLVKNLIKIDGRRFLTTEGKNVLNKL